ncbi:hypothetical protein ZIOFF_010296 [Zingiber officinale]|uniref:Pentatricopeptide repeat-containing protein n=1 Tax=Zingiber officinale TaxID=94328 RepID=A0A8J5HV68_ZINOF|nr:hypothetical protein ZIOFF_010296 [Zingiber officinale]
MGQGEESDGDATTWPRSTLSTREGYQEGSGQWLVASFLPIDESRFTQADKQGDVGPAHSVEGVVASSASPTKSKATPFPPRPIQRRLRDETRFPDRRKDPAEGGYHPLKRLRDKIGEFQSVPIRDISLKLQEEEEEGEWRTDFVLDESPIKVDLSDGFHSSPYLSGPPFPTMTMPCSTAPSPAALSINDHHVSLLHRCTTLHHLKQLQTFLLSPGHGCTQFSALKLLCFSALVLAGIPYASLIFDSLLAPNVFLYSTLISAYASRPGPDSPAVLRLFAAMLRVAPPLAPTSSSIPPSSNSAPTTASPAPSSPSLDSTTSLSRAPRSLIPTPGQMGKSLFMFEEMPDTDVPAWNAVISGCNQNGLFFEVLSFFSRMVWRWSSMAVISASCLFSACAHLGMLRLGKSLHGYVFKNSMGDSPFVCNAHIDMHSKCGNVKKARWIFSTMSEKNITSWNSMINSLALQGHSSLAIETFCEMEQEGPQPDQVTFMGLLNACTHAALVDEGLGYLNSITGDYTIDPEIKYYGCAIDLLSRAGFMVPRTWLNWHRGSYLSSNLRVWTMASCSQIYIECGKWEDVGSKEEGMIQQVRQMARCSWIEVEKTVHQFYSSDTIHPEVQQIYEILDEVVVNRWKHDFLSTAYFLHGKSKFIPLQHIELVDMLA